MKERDACSRCSYGLKFDGRQMTYWCRARKDVVKLTSQNFCWEKICSYYNQKAVVGKELVQPHPGRQKSGTASPFKFTEEVS